MRDRDQIFQYDVRSQVAELEIFVPAPGAQACIVGIHLSLLESVNPAYRLSAIRMSSSEPNEATPIHRSAACAFAYTASNASWRNPWEGSSAHKYLHPASSKRRPA